VASAIRAVPAATASGSRAPETICTPLAKRSSPTAVRTRSSVP
jgi:hypothetical protein